MIQIQCECGKFRAELTAFPKHTPGRLKCYCDDCQTYLHALKRVDALDANGGTEVIPAYPSEFKILSGQEYLKCLQLSPKGMFRFSTTCCNTPVCNTGPNQPWLGVQRTMFRAEDNLEKILGPVKASIMGKYAKGTPPPGTPDKFNLKGMITVLPHILRGKILGKARPSPFFTKDGAPIIKPNILSSEERQAAERAAGVR